MNSYSLQFASYCKNKYQVELNNIDERSYCYHSLPICIIDCIYSLFTNYSRVTVPVTQRYADHFLGGNRSASDDSDSLSDFIKNINKFGLDGFANNIVKNHQKSGGVRKDKVCLDLAITLHSLGINTLKDFQEYPSRKNLEKALYSVRGVGNSAVNYLFMLTGDENKTKPDVHIHHAMEEVFGRDMSDADCIKIVSESANILKKEYKALTIRQLDGILWKDFSSRKKGKNGQR